MKHRQNFFARPLRTSSHAPRTTYSPKPRAAPLSQVVTGEAGMLSAQLMGPNKAPFGMNRPGIDNRQLALNIMHWLSRLI